ncbi:MAG: hypothetical protein J7M12_00675 [Candidatus Hydrogenedentes bacterium]|nr:hypothetical protein [Candidatus Hydrogenedentota bacterium]
MNVSRHSTLLSIVLDGKRMAAVVDRRVGRTVKIRQTARVPLSLDPLSDDPQLVGREIRNRLDEAGIRKKRCVICVPLNWALILNVQMPDTVAELTEQDIESFISVQAEREFPFAPEDLSISVSRYSVPDGGSWSTLTAIPVNHLTVLDRVMKEARLKPVSMTLGISSLVDHKNDDGRISLFIGEQNLDLVVVAGGGIVTLRSLDEAVNSDQDDETVDVELVARQLRITLGQMPETLSRTVRSVCVYGVEPRVDELVDSLRQSFATQDIPVERGLVPNVDMNGSDPLCSPVAAAAAARLLLGAESSLEFMPPHVSMIKRVAGRVTSRATLWLATATCFIAIAIGGMFLLQHIKLSRLETYWAGIEPTVKEARAIQEKIKAFRPWFDDSPQTLMIARKLTEAFPEQGTVWVKSISMKNDLTEISCTGYARDDAGWMDVLDRLRDTAGIKNMQVINVQGDSPLRFTFIFEWDRRAGKQ